MKRKLFLMLALAAILTACGSGSASKESLPNETAAASETVSDGLTIPLMLGVGLVSGKLNKRFAKPMRYASAAPVLAMGVSALASGLALAGAVTPAAKPTGEDGVAIVQDGVQYVRSELDYGGYPVITVQAGIPVEWTIHAEEDRINSCNHEIYIPKFDLSVTLEPGDNLIRFTPDTAGSIPYTCWMGMIRSTIYVTDDAA